MEFTDDLSWKEIFFKDNFNVDQCLTKYTLKTDLETLRNNLKKYGDELHQQMAEILKTETEAIVTLAEYLTNLSSRIDDLSLPISQLREEIKSLFDLIKEAEISYYNTLQSIKRHRNDRCYLNLKLGILSSAVYIDKMIEKQENLFQDSVILERIVNKYSFEHNYLEALGLSSDISEVSSVGKKLTEMLNGLFLNSVENNEEAAILRCLRMYQNLNQQPEAERIYQIHVVRPEVRRLFSESYLESCGQDVSKIYEEALGFIDTKMGVLLKILMIHPELKSFHFILNSFWTEIDKQSREGLPHITAPGNPELFQNRFKSTWSFLLKISEKCGDENLIFTNKTFQEHIKRFNLPVYFEIRFQQIAGQFENDAVVKPGPLVYSENNEIGCRLRITLALWKAVLRTFSSDVFIENLADQFLKLSMLLLARYLKWFESALEESAQFTEGSEAWEDFIISSVFDLNVTKNLLSDSSNVYNIMPSSTKPALPNVFNVNSSTINRFENKLQEHLISIKSTESLAHLQNVAAIPRLYRRTNRSAPKEPSNYMVEAVEPILKFSRKFKSLEKFQGILDVVITTISKQYLSLVEDVLRSVCKTEESLRRLKNRSAQFSEIAFEEGDGSDTVSDEVKIREQIKLDVSYFVEKLYSLAQENARKSMDELRKQTG